MEHQSITCPRCGAKSYHPEDIRQGYCGMCQWWTSDPDLAPHIPSVVTDQPTVDVSELLDLAVALEQPAPWEKMDTVLAPGPSWWERLKARFR